MKIILFILCMLAQTIHAFELIPTHMIENNRRRLKQQAQIRKLNHFLLKSHKSDEKLKYWLQFAIRSHLPGQTKALLKAGALNAQNNYYPLLTKAFGSNLNNFKRLLLYGASYRSLLFCQHCYLNEMPMSKEKASFIQAMIDFGPIPYEKKPQEITTPPSLKDLSCTKLVNSISQNKKQLVSILRQSPPDIHHTIVKGLVNYAAHNQPLLLIQHVAYAKNKLSKNQFSNFFELVDRCFNDLHAEKYNTLHTRMNLYSLRATDFKDIYKEARALTE